MDLMSQFSSEVPELKKYRFTIKNVVFAKMMVSRTGYTGEDGVEVILPAKFAKKAVNMLLKNIDLDADDAAVKPIGLGARDTLRLEAGMPLYGHELTEELDPVSAGLTFAIELDKGDDEHGAEPFIGQDALKRIADQGPAQKLVGLVLEGKRSARQDMSVLNNGERIGFITSGCSSPTIGKPIAMAFVDVKHCEPGTNVQVDLGRAQANAEVVTLPFYKAK
jgi:aminomethyltransferase